MNAKDIRMGLYKVLRKTGVPREHILEEASFKNDMFMDDIDMTCFLYYLETKFNLNIENEAIPHFVSVSSTIDYLQRRCA
ncbi:MAG: acyl carrier protein [Marinilabiliaceae bacterium]|nr:acyl carrier protein [Marinilabiliaceae bacterium]